MQCAAPESLPYIPMGEGKNTFSYDQWIIYGTALRKSKKKGDVKQFVPRPCDWGIERSVIVRVDLAGIAGAVPKGNHINSAVLKVKYWKSSYYIIHCCIKSSHLALNKIKWW